MRIDNSYLSGLGASEIRGNTESAETGQKGEVKSDSVSESNLHVPSPELTNLLQLVQLSPDVRPDVLSRVSQLLDSGYYATGDAADRTAASMINAIE